MLCTIKKGYTLAFISGLGQDRCCIIQFDYRNDNNQNKNSTIFLLFKDQNLVFCDGKFWSLDKRYHKFTEQLF